MELLEIHHPDTDISASGGQARQRADMMTAVDISLAEVSPVFIDIVYTNKKMQDYINRQVNKGMVSSPLGEAEANSD